MIEQWTYFASETAEYQGYRCTGFSPGLSESDRVYLENNAGAGSAIQAFANLPRCYSLRQMSKARFVFTIREHRGTRRGHSNRIHVKALILDETDMEGLGYAPLALMEDQVVAFRISRATDTALRERFSFGQLVGDQAAGAEVASLVMELAPAFVAREWSVQRIRQFLSGGDERAAGRGEALRAVFALLLGGTQAVALVGNGCEPELACYAPLLFPPADRRDLLFDSFYCVEDTRPFRLFWCTADEYDRLARLNPNSGVFKLDGSQRFDISMPEEVEWWIDELLAAEDPSPEFERVYDAGHSLLTPNGLAAFQTHVRCLRELHEAPTEPLAFLEHARRLMSVVWDEGRRRLFSWAQAEWPQIFDRIVQAYERIVAGTAEPPDVMDKVDAELAMLLGALPGETLRSSAEERRHHPELATSAHQGLARLLVRAALWFAAAKRPIDGWPRFSQTLDPSRRRSMLLQGLQHSPAWTRRALLAVAPLALREEREASKEYLGALLSLAAEAQPAALDGETLVRWCRDINHRIDELASANPRFLAESAVREWRLAADQAIVAYADARELIDTFEQRRERPVSLAQLFKRLAHTPALANLPAWGNLLATGARWFMQKGSPNAANEFVNSALAIARQWGEDQDLGFQHRALVLLHHLSYYYATAARFRSDDIERRFLEAWRETGLYQTSPSHAGLPLLRALLGGGVAEPVAPPRRMRFLVSWLLLGFRDLPSEKQAKKQESLWREVLESDATSKLGPTRSFVALFVLTRLCPRGWMTGAPASRISPTTSHPVSSDSAQPTAVDHARWTALAAPLLPRIAPELASETLDLLQAFSAAGGGPETSAGTLVRALGAWKPALSDEHWPRVFRIIVKWPSSLADPAYQGLIRARADEILSSISILPLHQIQRALFDLLLDLDQWTVHRRIGSPQQADAALVAGCGEIVRVVVRRLDAARQDSLGFCLGIADSLIGTRRGLWSAFLRPFLLGDEKAFRRVLQEGIAARAASANPAERQAARDVIEKMAGFLAGQQRQAALCDLLAVVIATKQLPLIVAVADIVPRWWPDDARFVHTQELYELRAALGQLLRELETSRQSSRTLDKQPLESLRRLLGRI